MRILVTGAAGFIGSHMAHALLAAGHDVSIIDNLSHGHDYFLPKDAKFIKKDLTKDNFESDFSGIGAIFHFAADPDVRASAQSQSSFDNNVVATFRLLEACRKMDVKNIIFASTSTVYGEAKKLPTPEDYLCNPISNYGASKLACEAFCASYSASYGMHISILRYANIFGERSMHGAMHDFFHKLKKNPNHLEILGNGKQEKSYLYITDAVDATLLVWKKQGRQFDIFNVGSTKKIKVEDIARKMCMQLSLQPQFKYSGGDRGWIGDVPLMLLDVKKLQGLGWREKISFDEGLKRYMGWMENFSKTLSK